MITNYIKAHLGLKQALKCPRIAFLYDNKLYQSSSWFETLKTNIPKQKNSHNKLYQSSSWFETCNLQKPIFQVFFYNKLYQSSSWFETILQHIYWCNFHTITNYIKAHLGLKQ